MNKAMIPVLLLGMVLGSVAMFVGQSFLSEDDLVIQNKKASERSESENSETANPVMPGERDRNDPASTKSEESNPTLSKENPPVGETDSDSANKAKSAGSNDLTDPANRPVLKEKSSEKPSSLKEIIEAVRGLSAEDKVKVLDEIAGGEAIEDDRPQIEITATLSGTVVDALGNPVPGAGVFATLIENSGDHSSSTFILGLGSSSIIGEQIATSDNSGVWSAEVSKKVYEGNKLTASLVARAEGFADSKAKEATVADKQTETDISITLRGSGSVSGWVRDAAGLGIEGVEVGLDPVKSDNGFGGFIFGDFENSSSKYNARTDAAGFYRIEGIPEGRHKFKLKLVGVREKSGPKEVKVLSGKDTKSEIDFVVERTSSVVVKLQDKDGEPISGWGVLTLIGEDGGEAFKGNLLVQKGTAEISDPPSGRFQMVISVWGYKDSKTSIDVRDGQSTRLDTMILESEDQDPVD
ncbi:carboxypeptidase-like regulatory domain-containing protein [Planctomycetota bacterium]|nr:carboxypeptidase-like regulatory domain-containing protein [Planctomycetota bacterium]